MKFLYSIISLTFLASLNIQAMDVAGRLVDLDEEIDEVGETDSTELKDTNQTHRTVAQRSENAAAQQARADLEQATIRARNALQKLKQATRNAPGAAAAMTDIGAFETQLSNLQTNINQLNKRITSMNSSIPVHSAITFEELRTLTTQRDALQKQYDILKEQYKITMYAKHGAFMGWIQMHEDAVLVIVGGGSILLGIFAIIGTPIAIALTLPTKKTSSTQPLMPIPLSAPTPQPIMPQPSSAQVSYYTKFTLQNNSDVSLRAEFVMTANNSSMTIPAYQTQVMYATCPSQINVTIADGPYAGNRGSYMTSNLSCNQPNNNPVNIVLTAQNGILFANGESIATQSIIAPATAASTTAYVTVHNKADAAIYVQFLTLSGPSSVSIPGGQSSVLTITCPAQINVMIVGGGYTGRKGSYTLDCNQPGITTNLDLIVTDINGNVVITSP